MYLGSQSVGLVQVLPPILEALGLVVLELWLLQEIATPKVLGKAKTGCRRANVGFIEGYFMGGTRCLCQSPHSKTLYKYKTKYIDIQQRCIE